MEYLVILGYFAALFETGGDTTSVTSADFDDDGAPDLAIANSADDDVSIFLNVSRTRGPRAAPR